VGRGGAKIWGAKLKNTNLGGPKLKKLKNLGVNFFIFFGEKPLASGGSSAPACGLILGEKRHGNICENIFFFFFFFL
jgi:hypothetical protein